MPEGPRRGSEARPEPLEVNGRVLESLPNALFKVELETEKRQTITAHVAGSSSLLRILPGEAVVVELMAYDPRRGRIVRRRS
ncbi:MAG: translation initiation factor IF-1 [Acidobacteria bacterium]|nr:MAG: translation initiation factor IF-1 [Acidobacteriota bacterium]